MPTSIPIRYSRRDARRASYFGVAIFAALPLIALAVAFIVAPRETTSVDYVIDERR